MYEQFFGAIPDGLETHHLCLNRHCCNQGHVMMVSREKHVELTPGHFVHTPVKGPTAPEGIRFNQANTRIDAHG